MKEIPILFKPHMVRAILEGFKSETRRIIPESLLGDWPKSEGFKRFLVENAPVKRGDLLWVRESFSHGEIEYCNDSYKIKDNGNIIFRADISEQEFLNIERLGLSIKWKPSIFLHKENARIWLKVLNVRAQRIQEISEYDAQSEGVLKSKAGEWLKYPINEDKETCSSAKNSFRTLWDSIHKANDWNSNPYVWVYDFSIDQKRSVFNVRIQKDNSCNGEVRPLCA